MSLESLTDEDHIFCCSDPIQGSFGACVYLHPLFRSEKITVRLLTTKSRVANQYVDYSN